MNHDTDRPAVYDAEDRVRRWALTGRPVTVFGSTWDPEPLARFQDVAAVQRYVDQVLSHCLRTGRHTAAASVHVRVRARRGTTRAHYEALPPVIAVPAADGAAGWAMNEMVVLHELAHHLTPRAHHGPDFRAAFLDLLAATNHPVLSHLTQLAFLDAGLAPLEGASRGH